MPLTLGDRIAHYDVTALIGEGGMGQVYQATDTKLNRQVASHPGLFLDIPHDLFMRRKPDVAPGLNVGNQLFEDDDP